MIELVALLRSSISATAVRYVLVGVANTCVSLGVIYAAMYFLSFGDTRANALGYLVGVTVSFVLNRNWTFGHAGAIVPALTRFIGVLLAAYFVNLATVVLLIDAFGVNRYVAQAAGVVPYTTVGYLGSRYIAFRGQSNAASP